MSASCAYGDLVFLGFGNGSLVIFNSAWDVSGENEIVYHDKDFAQDRPVEKLKIVYIDTPGG